MNLDDERDGPRWRHNGDGPGSRRDIEDRDDWSQEALQEADKRRKKLETWYLAVELLKGWDDKTSCTAEGMEQTLSRFLQDDAKQFHRITPRLSTEIFLRGMLRTLWDIDRLLRDMNPGEDLKRYTKSPLVLSTLRVCAYELMWTPSGTVREAVQGANDLMKKAGVSFKTEQEFVSSSVARMMKAFDKGHQEWDTKRKMREENKQREKAEKRGMPRGRKNIGAAVGQVKRRPGVDAAARKLAASIALEGGKRPKLSAPGLISARADMEEEDGMEDGEADEMARQTSKDKDDSASKEKKEEGSKDDVKDETKKEDDKDDIKMENAKEEKTEDENGKAEAEKTDDSTKQTGGDGDEPEVIADEDEDEEQEEEEEEEEDDDDDDDDVCIIEDDGEGNGGDAGDNADGDEGQEEEDQDDEEDEDAGVEDLDAVQSDLPEASPEVAEANETSADAPEAADADAVAKASEAADADADAEKVALASEGEDEDLDVDPEKDDKVAGADAEQAVDAEPDQAADADAEQAVDAEADQPAADEVDKLADEVDADAADDSAVAAALSTAAETEAEKKGEDDDPAVVSV